MITTITSPSPINTTITSDTGTVVTTTLSKSVAVSTIVNIGLPGSSASVGVGSYVAQTQIASESIGGHIVVYMSPTGVAIASSSVVNTANKILGLTSGSVVNGQPVEVVTSGTITEPSWSWTVGDAVYVSTNGTLTQTVPTSGYILQVGIATNPTTINIDLKLPIIL